MAGPVCIIDFETNGCPGGCHVDSKNHRIIQFAATTTSDPPREFCEFVATDYHIPLASTAIHGITNEDVRVGAPFGDVWVRFRAWLAALQPAATKWHLVAHNMFGFDGRILRTELARCGRVDDLEHFVLSDTLPAFRSAMPGLEGGYSLGALYVQLTGKMFGASHHALSDVRALRQLMICAPHVSPITTGKPLPFDGEPITALRGIGAIRGIRIADFLRKNSLSVGDPNTVGALRRFYNHFGWGGTPGLEMLLRDVVNVFDDGQLREIARGITGEWHEPTRPYFKAFGRPMFSGKVERYLQIVMNIRTRSQLQELFVYTAREDPATFRRLLKPGGLEMKECDELTQQVLREWRRHQTKDSDE